MGVLLPQRRHHVPQAGEGPVDVLRLLQPVAGDQRLVHPLASGEVDQMQAAIDRAPGDLLSVDVNRKNTANQRRPD